MMEKKQGEKNTKDPEFEHLDVFTANAASATDLTGLVPANPRPEDMEAYGEIHSLAPEAAAKKKDGK